MGDFFYGGLNMAVDSLQYAIGNSASTVSSSGINNTDTSLPITSDTNFNAKSGAGMVLIDEGTATEELAYSTSKGGSTLAIPLVNRGLEGGSPQAHTSGVTVKGILTAGMWNNLIDALTHVVLKTTGAVDTTKIVTPGGSQTLTNKTLTSPVINTPTGIVKGDVGLTNVDNTSDATKNSASVTLTNHVQVAKVASYSPTSSPQALDLSTGGIQTVTMYASLALTLTISNATTGQCFIVNINNVTSQGVLTWFSTIRWQDGVTPTLTGTNGKRDCFGFIVTGAGTYDGFVIGQNI